MKKYILALLIATVAGSSFGYQFVLNNNSGATVYVIAAGQTLYTVNNGSVLKATLDDSTSYAINYQGQWSPQGLFTLQQYSAQVLQNTPMLPAAGRLPVTISYTALSNATYEGSVNNLTDSSGQDTFSGNCTQDTGASVTCYLSQGQNQLQTLTVDLKSY